jgi:hypothetical protein
VAASVREESLMGAKSKFDVKVGLLTVSICLHLLKLMKACAEPSTAAQTKPSARVTDSDGWEAGLKLMCAHVMSRVGCSGGGEGSTTGEDSSRSQVEEDEKEDDGEGREEFSDWDDSSDEEGKGEGEGDNEVQEGQRAGDHTSWSCSEGSGDIALLRSAVQEVMQTLPPPC